jgi:hypothetical protein
VPTGRLPTPLPNVRLGQQVEEGVCRLPVGRLGELIKDHADPALPNAGSRRCRAVPTTSGPIRPQNEFVYIADAGVDHNGQTRREVLTDLGRADAGRRQVPAIQDESGVGVAQGI